LPLSATDLRLNYCGFKPIHCYTIKITSQQISDRRFPTNSFKKRKSKRSKSERVIESSDGSGSKIFDPGQVDFLWLGLGRVIHLWFEFGFGKFLLKMSNFSIFFPFGQKKSLPVGSKSTRIKGGLGSYLLRVKSKLG